MLHFLIVQLGSPDLFALALSSIRKYAPASMVDIVPLPADTCDPRAHGAAIDQWRETYEGQVRDTDAVVIMDPDAVLLSHQWRRELDRVLFDENVGNVGIWGAGASEDFGPRVHAHMMAIRGKVWNTLRATFTPCKDAREQTWRDTGGLYCLFAKDAGWEVQPLERGPDWHGVSAWWGMKPYVPGEWVHTDDPVNHFKNYPFASPVPLWAHLGGGSHSDTTRMTWPQRISRWRSVQQRKQ